MKIAVIVYNLTGGGAERVASLWLNGFYQRGYDVSAILLDTHTPISYSINDNIKIYSIDTNSGTNKYLNAIRRYFLRTKRLRKVFQTIQPDIVISVMLDLGPLVYKAKGNMKFKVIGTDHNVFECPKEFPMSSKNKYLKFDFSKKFDFLTVLTNSDYNIIKNTVNNVAVLPNPLAFEPATKINHKEKIILAVGRYDAWHVKGFDVLIEAWSKIASKHPLWKLQILGQGNKKNTEFLQKLISQKSISKQACLIPYTPELLNIYRNSEIFCLSSRYEGFGMVLVEAMSQGCACVACDYKGRQKDIIRNNQEGVICKPNDVDSLSKAIDLLLSNDEYRHTLQKNSPNRSVDYSLDKIMDIWETIIKKVNEDIN